jgi:hypothetical protein
MSDFGAEYNGTTPIPNLMKICAALHMYIVDLFNNITMSTFLLPHKAHNPLTANDHHTVATVITTHIHKYYHVRPKVP